MAAGRRPACRSVTGARTTATPRRRRGGLGCRATLQALTIFFVRLGRQYDHQNQISQRVWSR